MWAYLDHVRDRRGGSRNGLFGANFIGNDGQNFPIGIHFSFPLLLNHRKLLMNSSFKNLFKEMKMVRGMYDQEDGMNVYMCPKKQVSFRIN